MHGSFWKSDHLRKQDSLLQKIQGGNDCASLTHDTTPTH